MKYRLPVVRMLLRWRFLWWSGAMVLGTAAYFANSNPGWSANSQFALTRAIVEHGTVAIDAYHQAPGMETGDKAWYRGHFYCDKSPLLPLLGVPVYWCYRHSCELAGITPDFQQGRYWTTLVVVGGSLAGLAILLAWFFHQRGVSPARAALGGAGWMVATPLMGFGVLFSQYAPTGLLLLGSFACVQDVWRSTAAVRPGRVFAGGMLAGLAVWGLSHQLLAVTGITGLLLAGLYRRRCGVAVTVRTLLWWGIGGLAGIAGQLVYGLLVFDSWLALPYHYEYDEYFRTNLARGMLGVTRPDAWVVWLLLFHPFRGLLLWWPATLLALVGAGVSAVKPRAMARSEALAIVLVAAGLVACNSAYFVWWGGWSYAPRHLLPALPLLALGLVPWLRHAGKPLAGLLLAGIGISAVLNLTAVAVDPQPSPMLDEQLLAVTPAREVVRWPSPYLNLQWCFWQEGWCDRNFGHGLGLTGAATLVPLAAFWITGLVVLRRMARRPIREEQRGRQRADVRGS